MNNQMNSTIEALLTATKRAAETADGGAVALAYSQAVATLVSVKGKI